MTTSFSVADVLRSIGTSAQAHGNHSLTVRRMAPLHEADGECCTWVRSGHAAKQRLVETSRAAMVICDDTIEVSHLDLEARCIVRVANPELGFLRVMKSLFAIPHTATPGIHHTAIVDPEAQIGPSVSIGPYCVIGRVSIGEGSMIQSFVSIHDDTVLGRRVFVADHCSIGGQGFGHVRNEVGDLENMPHVGRVVIEDDVELFPHTNVDRATLSETRICRGAKIDHYCHIGHNTRIGEGSVLAAKIVLCGGVRIGSACWIGVGTLVRDGLEIGDHASTGFGSIVTRSIPPGEVWAGSPAKPIAELVALQRHLRRLATS